MPAVQSHLITKRMSGPSLPSPHPIREFDFDQFTQTGPQAFFNLLDKLRESFGDDPQWVDVVDCLHDLREQHQVFRFMHHFMVEGGAPPGYMIELIGKETYKCYNKVWRETHPDEESSDESSEEPEA